MLSQMIQFAYVVQRNVLTIPKFLEHVCLTACVGLPGIPPSGPLQISNRNLHFLNNVIINKTKILLP
jgi:hypothetical protein